MRAASVRLAAGLEQLGESSCCRFGNFPVDARVVEADIVKAMYPMITNYHTNRVRCPGNVARAEIVARGL